MARWLSKRPRNPRINVIITMGKITMARMVCEVKMVKVHGARPSLTLEMFRRRVRIVIKAIMIVKITSQKKCRSHHCGDHRGAMCSHPPMLDEIASNQQQDCVGAIQRGIDLRENSVLRQNLHYAAGLVVRRFTRKKHNPNMKSVNRASAAIEAGSDKTVGLSGYRSTRKASTP